MKKFLIFSLSILAFTILLFVGISIGLRTTQAGDDSLSDAQHNLGDALLVIEIDSFRQSPIEVKSLTLISINLEEKSIAVSKFSAENHPKFDELVKNFMWTEKNGVSRNFISGLKKSQISFDKLIILDETGIKQLNEWINTDYPEAANADGSVSFCHAVTHLPVSADFFPVLLMVIPNHFKSDLSIDAVFSGWKNLTQIPDGLTCEIIQ